MNELRPLLASLTGEMNGWLREDDPLIGELTVPDEGDDVVLALAAQSRRAAGLVRRSDTPLSDAMSLWQASTRENLQLRCSPEATTADISNLLDSWLEHPMPEVSEPGGDRARSVRLPVPLRQAIVPLLEYGFTARTVTLARRLNTPPPVSPSPALIRPAREDDGERMRELMRELMATEVSFGSGYQRAPEVSDHHVEEALTLHDGWAVVAEIDGLVVGWASMAPPEFSGWAAPSVRPRPAAYFGNAVVDPAVRSGGIGRALASTLHNHAHSHGVDTIILDAASNNTWSVPFWHRLGYRPLWTTWRRRYPTSD
ncbi:MAG: GNAT family N-acetyltransferase [Flaviflexus sp.]|uniref:GNAT family N-acetyltransferase n=1 Tax=Flaviflexus sp. TaxID=1969482 RepID=UPI00352CC935